MNKQDIKTSELYKMEQIAYSVTVAPENDYFTVRISLRERTKKGQLRTKTIKVNRVIEDSSIPEVSNRNVVHLGYNTYKHIVLQSGFYINLYYN